MTKRLRVVGVAMMVFGMALMVWIASRADTSIDSAHTASSMLWNVGIALFLTGAGTYSADWLWDAIKRQRAGRSVGG